MRLRAKLLVWCAGLMAIGAPAFAAPTFTKDVAPILYENCVSCHRPNDVAPMSLLTYNEVRPWAKAIEKNVSEGVMPPWHADPGYGPFKNERSLTKAEVATIVEWIQAGTPQGDPSDLPEAPEFQDAEWRLGEPDYIVEFGEISVPAGGPDQFHALTAKTDFPEDKWITAIEIKPSSRKVVHHVILWQGAIGGTSGETNGWLSAWAAGAEPDVFPEGTGRLLKKGADIVGDMHYHPADTSETDRTQVGFHFAESADIEKELINLWVMNAEFEIPAGDPNYEARSTFQFAQDSHILGLAPHLHYRGKDFAYTVTYPDGKTEELLKVSKYDFNWQTNYLFEKPIAAPKGTRIDCVAHWDNSANNPANPDPTKNISFGPQSYDEMMIGFVDYIVDEGVRPKPTDPMLAKVAELVAKDAGNVFTIQVPQGPNDEMQLNAVHVPKEGAGAWYVKFNALVVSAQLRDIKWDGNSFACRMIIPGQGENQLSGTYDAASKQMHMKMVESSGDVNEMSADLAQ